MNITKIAIEKNRITTVVLIIVIIGGMIAFKNLPRQEDPGFIIRTAMIQTFFPGASPERVENLISDKLEKTIQEIPELDFVSSTSKMGLSVIIVQIKESYKEMRPIWDNLRRKIDRVVPSLPDGIVGPFVNDEFGDVFGIVLTITGEGYTYAELKVVADQVRDELLHLEDAAKVDIYGAQSERIFVDYSNSRLTQIGISPYQMKQILESQNILFPGGSITAGREKITLEPSGNFESVEELRKTIIQIPGKPEVLYLGDIANVYRGYKDPPNSMMRSSGQECLGLGISLRKGGNILALGESVKEKIEYLQGQYPIGIEFDFIAFQPDEVKTSVDNFISSLFQAISIVILVMLIALGFRTGILIASLIPTTMLLALMLMGPFGITINTISLAALMISLGLLVDNAIVMSESIMVQIQEGKNSVKAAIDSAVELRIPLLISSLTTAAAFLPIYLAESDTGEYCADLFKVVSIALLSSWILALTVIPVLCVAFMKVKSKEKDSTYNSKYYSGYRHFLIAILRRPILSIIVIIIVFAASMQLTRFIPSIFFPPSDRSFLKAELTWPLGTSIEFTEAKVKEIGYFIRDSLVVNEQRGEGITNWASFIGEGAPRYYLSISPEPPTENYAYMLMNTTSREVADGLINRIENFCTDRFPDLKALISPLDYGPPVMAPIQIRISGKDPEVIFSIVDEVKQGLTGLKGTKNIDDNWGIRSKKLLVEVNQPRARRAGVTSQDIAISLQTTLSGMEPTQFREDDKVIPVVLRAEEADRKDLGKLETLDIYSRATGRTLPLSQVADIKIVWEPSKILRRNRLKTVTVESYLESGLSAIDIINNYQPVMEKMKKTWPVGYSYEFGGEIESSEKSSKSIGEKLPIAFGIIILLLVGQFNSFRKPIIVLATIPLALIGVFFGLFITGSYMGFMTFLGVISLAGIVINNAIVLLDRIRIEQEEHGLDPQRAIIEAAQKRMRPILLTTATTIGGMLPLWLGGGAMWESMAIAIIFGLLISTILTLGVVPVLYSLFFRVKFKEFKY
ncbi:MAG: efflux RND transporter permease subunit [candidate division Zixibacteria bacterium]|nr:efflux RND transporter permease subunit [candidate division Zixibacteria bacterium]